MPKIVVTAAVKDVEAWLKFKPALIAQMSAVASDGTSYVAMDGSNSVARRSGSPVLMFSPRPWAKLRANSRAP